MLSSCNTDLCFRAPASVSKDLATSLKHHVQQEKVVITPFHSNSTFPSNKLCNNVRSSFMLMINPSDSFHNSNLRRWRRKTMARHDWGLNATNQLLSKLAAVSSIVDLTLHPRTRRSYDTYLAPVTRLIDNAILLHTRK
jgi:hypothetical protein